jgi:4-amino-4-deoxy-L-arabinose transferase-like glycosyltransferase
MFLLGLLAHLAGQVVLGAYLRPQVFEYEEVASNLLAGRGYLYQAPDGGDYFASQSSPLYIVLTAGVYLLTNHSQAVMLFLQAVMGGVTAALAAWLGGRVFSRRAGVAAGALVAIDPGLVVYGAQLHSLTLDALANVALLCVSVAVPQRPSARRLGGLGALFGVAALTRATALLLVPAYLLWLQRYRAVRLVSLPAVAMLVLAVLVYSPWPIRNSVVLGQLILGSSETTEWLWRGNNPQANGGSLTSSGQRMLDVAPAQFRAEIEAADEAQRVPLYRDAALAFVRDQPGRAAELYLTKLKAFWWGSDATGMLYPQSWLVAYRLWYVAVMLSAVWGIWRGLRQADQRPAVVLIVVSAAIVSATQAVFYVEGRHRLAIEPLVLIMSGAGLVALIDRLLILPRAVRGLTPDVSRSSGPDLA